MVTTNNRIYGVGFAAGVVAVLLSRATANYSLLAVPAVVAVVVFGAIRLHGTPAQEAMLAAGKAVLGTAGAAVFALVAAAMLFALFG